MRIASSSNRAVTQTCLTLALRGDGKSAVGCERGWLKQAKLD
jgi:hypothetical protein